jgi:hypothetical protein
MLTYRLYIITMTGFVCTRCSNPNACVVLRYFHKLGCKYLKNEEISAPIT